MCSIYFFFSCLLFHLLLYLLLNSVERAGQWALHPYCLTGCNHVTGTDRLRGLRVPDVTPAELVGRPGLLSMSAGDFTVRCAALFCYAMLRSR